MYSVSKKIEKPSQIKRKRSFAELTGIESSTKSEILSEKDLENISSSIATDEEKSPFLNKSSLKMPYSPSLPAMKNNHSLHIINDGNVQSANARGNFQVTGHDQNHQNFPSSISFPTLTSNHNTNFRSKSDNEVNSSILTSKS